MLEISVGDVWELASTISSQLEKLTADIGIEQIQGFVDPTIRALELLESVVEERSQLIEQKLTAEKIAENLRNMSNQENNKEAKKSDSCEKVVYEEQISSKNNELNQFQQTLAQYKIKDQQQQSEITRQRQMLATYEKRVTELSDELRLKECAIRELEADCDTLEGEANRLLEINNELRLTQNLTIDSSIPPSLGNDSIAAEISNCEDSFPENLPDRTGPEGEEFQEDEQDQTWSAKKSLDEKDKPRYTLYELEEVLNEKNKYKERCFVLEEKLRDLTNDESVLWEGLSIKDLEMVEPTTVTAPPTAPPTPSDPKSIRKMMSKWFRAGPTAYQNYHSKSSILPSSASKSELIRSDPVDDDIKTLKMKK
ncbi:Oidioi.mRNA.OKI2018_I69.PAR.g8808.t1.cds [Oikopleura dioica]|uniref:Oidioi.mRNA.OKI2018_I69.PAR.g8808.t1.cds n=1 Tax=Oikopleura dioica TaxID=34765 RepID=A0ABN7RM67_OIKDI|nr:Oidioi.mRNA.OKI2018_I69.PAR.g8808.t1.cds [Oikopleura dioica]